MVDTNVTRNLLVGGVSWSRKLKRFDFLLVVPNLTYLEVSCFLNEYIGREPSFVPVKLLRYYEGELVGKNKLLGTGYTIIITDKTTDSV